MESVRRYAGHERAPALGALGVIALDPASLDATHCHVDIPAIEERLTDAAGPEHLARVLVKEAEDDRCLGGFGLPLIRADTPPGSSSRRRTAPRRFGPGATAQSSARLNQCG